MSEYQLGGSRMNIQKVWDCCEGFLKINNRKRVRRLVSVSLLCNAKAVFQLSPQHIP